MIIMYTPVAFKYDGHYVKNLYVAVYPLLDNIYYPIVGISYGCNCPLFITEAGTYDDVKSALKKVKAIAEKYPPKVIENDIPEFTGI